MAYQYRCDDCGTTARAVATRPELAAVKGRHRQLAHHGQRPDGERVEIVGIRQRASWRTGCGALALVGLVFLDWLVRHI
ncbi:hypothetical protein [Streptomyces sp. Z26]|uniref:hypothetical protein n=1 Tax=Streptomyces sp. Z26 TaxID=2500177 RepID=UPI000EF13272|nr:hypothetical protein [Streptomyces sp. Z26]RLL68148.1 hypothetical protein D7M15_16335 [Streptomyces sp. Z26]